MRNKQAGRHTDTHNAPHRSGARPSAPTRAAAAQALRGSGHPGVIAPGRPSGLHAAPSKVSRGPIPQGRHNPKGGQTPPLSSSIHPIGIVGSSPITDPWAGASSTLDDRDL